MNASFENFSEEIATIFSRAKKDNYTVLYRIQKSKSIHIEQHNDQIQERYVQNFSGVNLTLISKEGYFITGTTTKVHLVDCMSRLYQSLDSLLKSNEGHKVHKSTNKYTLSTQKSNTLQYEKLQNFDSTLIMSTFDSIFSDVSAKYAESTNFLFSANSVYTLCLQGNTVGGVSESDDFMVHMSCSISSRENPSKKVTVTETVSPEEILNNSYNSNTFKQKIISHAEALLVETSKESDFIPDLVVLDPYLSSSILFKKMLAHDSHESCEDYFNDAIQKHKMWHQPTFSKSPVRMPKTLLFEDNNELSENNSSLEETIKALSEKYQAKNVLYICGCKDGTVSNTSDYIFTPATNLYFSDGVKKTLPYQVVELLDLEDIIYTKSEDITSLNIEALSFPICFKGNKLAIIQPTKEKVRFV